MYPVVLPRESHGHTSLVGQSPHDQKQSGHGLKQLSIHAGMHEMGEEGIQEISVCSSQFCCKSKTALHFKSLEKYIDFSKPAFFLNTMRVYVCTCMYAAAAAAKSLQSQIQIRSIPYQCHDICIFLTEFSRLIMISTNSSYFTIPT